MSFVVNFSSFGEPFSVPAEVVDKHIKLCGAVSLKVLLVLLRNAHRQMEAGEIAAVVGMPEPDVRDSLNYWLSANIISEGGNFIASATGDAAAHSQPAAAPIATVSEQPGGQNIVKVQSRVKLTQEEINNLSKTDGDITTLIHEAQVLLGDTLSPTATEILVSLRCYGGMSVEMILMVLQYCVSIDKRSVRYIETTAYDWIDRGIDTFEKAEAYIKEVTKASEDEKLIKSIFEITSRSLTPKERDYMAKWLYEYKFNKDMLSLARERALDANAARPFPYCDSILSDWFKKGITTPRAAVDEATAQSRQRAESDNLKPAPKRQYPDRQGYDRSAAPSPERELYDKAHAELQQRRALARETADKRKAEVYKSLPRIKEIDSLLSKTGFQISKAVLKGGNTKELLNTLKEQNLALQQERKGLLKTAGLPGDYLETPFHCKECEDKGYTPKGEPCGCLKALLERS